MYGEYVLVCKKVEEKTFCSVLKSYITLYLNSLYGPKPIQINGISCELWIRLLSVSNYVR